MDNLREADAIVDSLGKAMQSGESGLRYVPGLLLRVINEELWRKRIIVKTGQVAEFETFLEFVITEPLEGLGADLGTLKRLCRDNAAALDAIDRMTPGRQGARTDLHNNVMEVQCKEQGNSADYALRKLRADAPEMHARVLAGELTPHAAMVEAGYRKKSIQVPADPAGAARALCRKFTADELYQIVELITARIAT